MLQLCPGDLVLLCLVLFVFSRTRKVSLIKLQRNSIYNFQNPALASTTVHAGADSVILRGNVLLLIY